MTEISFYHLTQTPLERALPLLLGKIVQSNKRAILIASNEEEMKRIDDFLWTYGKFLGHGTKNGDHKSDQPIYITTDEENPNEAEILVLTGAVEASYIKDFTRCLDVFDGNDKSELAKARSRWKNHSNDDSVTTTYWKQSEKGVWESGK